jgi:hypothetical protein
MSRYAQFIVVLATLQAAASSVARAQSTAREAAGTTVSACSLLTAADIRRITGRSDLATSRPEPEELPGHSNCIHSGAFDIGVTVDETSRVMFDRMRDTYSRAPSRLGYRVETVSGLGDAAYFLMDKDRVKVTTLVGQNELTIALAKISMLPGELPPEPTAKAMALNLAKAAAAKLR